MPKCTREAIKILCGLALAMGGGSRRVLAQACTNEPFSYTDGALNGQGAWTGSATANEIAVSSNAVQIKSTLSATIVDAVLPVNCQPCEDGIITVSFKIQGDPSGNNSTVWGVYFDDPNNVNLARFYTGCMSVRGRTDGLSVGFVTVQMSLTGAPTFDECKAVIDTKNNITSYYLNGALMAVSPPNFVNPISHGIDAGTNQNPGNSIGRIRLERQATATATGMVTIDDIQITSCSGTCSLAVTPATAQVSYAKAGDPASPPTAVWTLANNNQDATGYTAQEVDASGAAHDYPWLSLDKAGGGPLNNGQTDTVTATLDTTGLTSGVYVGYVKFTDTCSSVRTYTRVVKLFIENCLTEDFNYPDTLLDRAPGWSGPAISSLVTYPAQIQGGVLKVFGDPWPSIGGSIATAVFDHAIASCPSCSVNGGLISVKLKAKGGTGASTIWRLFVTDAAGKEFASWFGTGTTLKGRVDNPAPNSTVITDTVTMSTTSFNQLEMRINTDDTRTFGGIPPHYTLFLVNGVAVTTTGSEAPTPHLNPIPYFTGAIAPVGRIHLDRPNNAGAAGDFLFLDDLSVGRCVEQCNDPVYDVRDTSNNPTPDGKVTAHDFNVFIGCATGPAPPPGVFDALSFECRCMDVTGDHAIDLNDFGRFQRCYTGTSGTLDPNCDN